jgi:thioredoxin reductase (NADPH)
LSNPGFTLGETALNIEKTNDQFIVTTKQGTKHQAPVVAIAGGLGVFIPRKPPIDNLNTFENKGIQYIVKDPEIFRNKRVVISGGGDSALDWAVELSKNSKVNLVHRRDDFRGAQVTVDKVKELAKGGKINLFTKYQINSIKGKDKLESLDIKNDDKESKTLKTDYLLGFFGLIMQLGPIANWGLNIDKKAIEVDTEKFETNQKGIYAVGDICSYPGPLKLILSGFHEGALAARACFKLARPDEKYRFEFTTSSKTIKDRLGVKSD